VLRKHLYSFSSKRG